MVSSLVVVAAHEGALTEAAHVVLPATSWAEHSGTYGNRQGLRQVSDRAIHPQGASQPGWSLIRQIAVALGVEPGWTKQKDIRVKLTITAAGLESAPHIPTASAS